MHNFGHFGPGNTTATAQSAAARVPSLVIHSAEEVALAFFPFDLGSDLVSVLVSVLGVDSVVESVFEDDSDLAGDSDFATADAVSLELPLRDL